MKLPTLAFPHAAGAAHNLRSLGDALRTLELLPQDYPGHGRRIREPLVRDLESLADDAFARCRQQLQDPYALLGHSMGARVALLVARRARVAGLAAPRALIVSGSPAPGRSTREPIHRLPHAEFVERVAEMGGLPEGIRREPAMMELFEPILRADFEAVETWEPGGEWTIDAPIVALHARDDSFGAEAVRAWSERTSRVVLFEELEGGHFFLYEAPAAAASVIDRDVARILNAR